jgi:hypothetical protein
MALQNNARASQAGRRTARLVIAFLTLICGLVAGCGDDNQKTSKNPVPALSSVSPANVVAGGSGLTLTVTGSGFVAGSSVHWNGVSRTTGFVSAAQLTASIPSSDVRVPGTAQVTVVNPAPGGGTSAALSFTIQNAAPELSALSPSGIPAGSQGFTLHLTGTGFVQGAQVQWAGTDRTTAFLDATRLSAVILASDVAQVGSFSVTVRNPDPTVGSSNSLSFAVTSVGVSISPATAEVEVGKTVQFTAAVTGTANTAVTWSVAGIAGGNSTVGTITDNGEYTAPLSVPSPSGLTIVAKSAADGTASDTATVTVASCSLAAPGPASRQTRARLGAYYFDGWSGPLTNFHFNGLVNGPYGDREPLTGWRDDSPCAVEQQFAWARRFGIDYFIFLWYHDPLRYADHDLNSALQITRSLADRHGMQFAIMYTDHEPFTVRPNDWTAVVDEWTGYMIDPDYVRVNGKPMLVLYDMEAMRGAFGSSAAVANAFNELRAAARARGLAGVYIVGGFFAGYDAIHQYGSFPDLSIAQAEGYDAVSMYNWSFGEVGGEQPFSILAEAGQWVWDQAALNSALPFIPTAMAGWDARPWYDPPVWFRRSPREVTDLVCAAITWANSNPQLRPEPSPGPPLVFIEAWNELGEGSYLVPTVGDGTSYGDSLAAMLAAGACGPP